MRESPLTLSDEAATSALGAALCDAWRAVELERFVVLLSGPLGAGKSTLARAFLRRAGVTGPIPSPTYTLIEPYPLNGVTVRHLDLYRLGDASELEPLGIRDVLDGIALIEWPDRAPALSGHADLLVSLELVAGGREATVEALSEAGRSVLEQLTCE